ncbi:MAG: OmpH family outer membrane protein, partial [Deltaproteobacteria bacterium]|nr:OmpH family outer membrane protein [Deltaproteobacteria bacterium]
MPAIKNVLIFALFALAALALFGGNAALAQAPAGNFVIGVVDVRKAIGDSKEGQAASKKLETKYNSLKKSLDTKQAELEKKDSDLRKQAQANTLSQDALEKRSQDLM